MTASKLEPSTFCSQCGAKNVDKAKFCAECGAMIPVVSSTVAECPPISPKRLDQRAGWVRSHWKVVVGVIAVIIIIVLPIELIFTQPWSKIQLRVYNYDSNPAMIGVYVDDVLMTTTTISQHGGGDIIGIYAVAPGMHKLGLDASFYPNSLDGSQDDVNTFQVGPFYTKNVTMYVGGL